MTEASHAGLALASALIDDGQYEKAEALLADSALLDTWENHQWQQYVEAYLMFATQRWPDVISVAATVLPPQAIIMSAVTAATCTLAAHAAAHLGQGRVALDWTDRVELRMPRSRRPKRTGASLTEATVAAIDPERFPVDRSRSGLCPRDGASPARRGGQGAGLAVEGDHQRRADRRCQQALADPTLQLVVTDEETINSRTNRWDVSTEQSSEDRARGRERRDGAPNCWPRAARCWTTRSAWPRSNGRSPNWRTRSRSGRCGWRTGCR